MGDLNRIRALVRQQDQVGNAAVVHSMVPLQNLFCYSGSLTSGRTSNSMQFDHYADAPRALAAVA
jgi:elongation factor G